MRNKFGSLELGIFAVVSVVFLNSVYSLFTGGKFLTTADRKPLAVYTEKKGSTRITEPSTASIRPSPPSGITGFIPYETKCNPTGESFETVASKVRILGPFCGASGRQLATVVDRAAPPSIVPVVESKVENATINYAATVFNDHAAGKFSTDFIPLEPGANKIIMEFRYKNGKTYPTELTIIRK